MNPDWTDAMIEDYLTLFENILLLAETINQKNDVLKTTTLITFSDSPYVPLSTDEEIYADTTAGIINITLPVGIDGTNYRIMNVGSVGNDANVIPSGVENLFGFNESERIADSEALIMTFETSEGWW